MKDSAQKSVVVEKKTSQGASFWEKEEWVQEKGVEIGQNKPTL